MRRLVVLFLVVVSVLGGTLSVRAEASVSVPDGGLTGQALVGRVLELAEDARGEGDVAVVGDPWAAQLVQLGRAILMWELRDAGGSFAAFMVSDGTNTIVGIISQEGRIRTSTVWGLDGDGAIVASQTRATPEEEVDKIADEVRTNCEFASEVAIGAIIFMFCTTPECELFNQIVGSPLASQSCKKGTRTHWYAEETTTYPTTTPGIVVRPWNDGTYVFDNYIEPLECLPPGSGPEYFGCYTYGFGGVIVPNRPVLGLTYKWPDGDEEFTGTTGDLLRVYPDIRQRTYGSPVGVNSTLRLSVLEDVRGITAYNGEAYAVHQG